MNTKTITRATLAILALVTLLALAAAHIYAQQGSFVSPPAGPIFAPVLYPNALNVAAVQAQLAQCITNGGGTVDARALAGLNPSYSSEIDVGNASGVPCTLMLPCAGSWTATMTGGSSYGIRVFTKSAILGCNSGEGIPFTIFAGGSSNLSVVCGNDPTNGQYIRMDGFACNAIGGATLVNGVLVIGNTADESYVGHMAALETSGTVTSPRALWVFGSHSSTVVEVINADVQNNASVPCLFGTNTNNTGIIVQNITCDHPGAGKNAVVINQASGATNGNTFRSIYMEEPLSGSADTTTAWISVQNTSAPVHPDFIQGIFPAIDIAASTRYVVDIAAGSLVNLQNIGQSNISTNFVNDHNVGGTTSTLPINSVVDFYTQNCFLGGAAGTTSPAGCGVARTGIIAIPASQTSYTVNTSGVNASSIIDVQQITDNSGISSATCNAGATAPIQSARVAGTSFTFTLTSVASVTCVRFRITN